MFLKLLRQYSRFISKISLKTRFIAILLINSLVTLSLVGAISYFTIITVQTDKVKNGVQATLDNIKTNIDYTLENITDISKQFAYENSMGIEEGINSDLKKYADYIDGSDVYSDEQIIEISKISNRIIKKIILAGNSNAIIGTIAFYKYGQKCEFMLSNKNIKDKYADISQFPGIINKNMTTILGLHETVSESNFDVVSVARKVEIPGREDVFVYLETNDRWFDNAINKKQYGMDVVHIITDKSNRVIFNGNNSIAHVGDVLNVDKRPEESMMIYKNFYLFTSTSQYGLKVIAAVDKNYYDRELRKWFYQFALIGVISLAVAVLLTMIMWRIVYRPIRAFSHEIKLMADYQPEPRVRKTRVKEFDELLFEFYEMRMHVIELIKQVGMKEKKQKELEIEKLLIQINPHFIYNTLNSVQWMARINNQKEIEKMISIFTRVLNYTLGKKSIIVTIEDELAALKDYIELQKMRYQYQLDVEINVDCTLMHLRIPRFIMQPLVENAIYHGMNDESVTIEVNISAVGDQWFQISVKDNGDGMTKEELERLLDEEKNRDRRVGLGIGLKYIDRMVKFYYGEENKISISSEKGQGTIVYMQLPLNLKEDSYD